MFHSIERINWNDKLLDSIYNRQDIDSLFKVIHLVDNPKLIENFIDILRSWTFTRHKKLLECMFQVIDHIDFTIKNNILLNYGCRCGYLEMVKYLIEEGADLHIDDETPLTWAAEEGRLEVVKYLVENGADLNNEYVLYGAAEAGQFEIVKYLVEKGADLHLHSDVIIAAERNCHYKVSRYLKADRDKKLNINL
jgi:ankyrin repeat protein